MSHPLFSHFENDQLDFLRSGLVAVYILATCGVVLGVILEGKRFPQAWQDRGWIVLVVALSFETLAGGMIFWVDAEIQTRLGNDVATLDKKSRNAAETAGSALAAAKQADRRLKQISGDLDDLTSDFADLSDDEASLSNGMSGLQVGQRKVASKQFVSEANLAALASRAETLRNAFANMTNEQEAFENALTPRSLEGVAVAKVMSPFSSIPIFVMADERFDDRDFANQLKAALTGEVGGPSIRKLNVTAMKPDGRLMYGIAIEYLGGANGPAYAAATALCRALADQGLDVRSPGFRWNASIPPNGILVRIGPREEAFFENKELAKLGRPTTPTTEEFADEAARLDKYSWCR